MVSAAGKVKRIMRLSQTGELAVEEKHSEKEKPMDSANKDDEALEVARRSSIQNEVRRI